MAKTLLVFDARSNVAPTSNAATLALANVRPLLVFSGTVDQSAVFEAVMPQAYAGGTLTAEVYFIMATDTSGDIDWDVFVEAITAADTVDLDAGDSFDSINSTDGTTVPGTAGYLAVVAVTLTDKDSVSAGDHVRFKVQRGAADDTANGEARLLKVEIREA
jgi:hypothetical protein